MKVKTLSALAGLGGSLILTGAASATYQGLSVIKYTSTGGHDVYRVYANFNNANDYFTGAQGSATLGALVIQSRNAADTAAGSNFFNPGGVGGNTAPTAGQTGNIWGTFVTVGVSMAEQGSGPTGTPDLTSLAPGFPNFINGNSLSSTNIGWFTAGPQEQGRAGYAGDGDVELRVLVAQLSVNTGENVRGTMAINGVNAGALAATFQAAGQTFSSVVPAPGALALLGLAGAVGSRRRRG